MKRQQFINELVEYGEVSLESVTLFRGDVIEQGMHEYKRIIENGLQYDKNKVYIFVSYDKILIANNAEEAWDIINNNKPINPEEINQGDLVNFGPYGQKYVCDPNYSNEYFWVTDQENERGNLRACGWTIPKYNAQSIIERY